VRQTGLGRVPRRAPRPRRRPGRHLSRARGPERSSG
jgi:hypothetical protein